MRPRPRSRSRASRSPEGDRCRERTAVLLPRPPPLDGTVTDVLVDAGTVAAIGPDLPAPEGAQVVDLDGRVLLPGPVGRARALRPVDARPPTPRSRAGPLRRRGGRRSSPPGCATDPPEPGTVLVGHGFRDALWPDAPHRDLLDPVTGAVPVVLVAADLHCCWLNSAAAARYGMADHPDRAGPGAGLDADHDGRASVPAALLDRWCRRRGAGGGRAGRGRDRRLRGAVAARRVGRADRRAAPTRCGWWRRCGPRRSTAPDGPIARGLRSGDVVPGTGGLLTMGPLKVVTDGSLNTRTACCDDPYPGLTGAARPRRCCWCHRTS